MTRLIASLLFLTFLAVGPSAAAADRPNIVLILADDFGYGSVRCYGGKGLETPNLDRLAAAGRRFTQAYTNGSVCSPTRYGLMTGRYYWRTSVKDGKVLNASSPLHIETDRLTLASLCKSKGYKTAGFGKWHLGIGAEGRITDWSIPLKPGPLEIGFDHFFGMAGNPWGGPHSFIEDHAVTGRVAGKPITVSGNRDDATTDGIKKPWNYNQITETLTGKAVAWMEKNHREPFFLYFAHTAVHRPIAPNPKFTGSRYGTYGNFIHELDWSVDRVLETLDRLKIADNTLVIFTSDNGGVIAPTPEHAAAQKAGLKVNGALRGAKHDIWEGGFRVPFIVRWPGKVPAGTVSDQVICLTDVLATLAGILGVELKPGQAEDSFDVRRAFFEATPGKPVRDHVILQAADAVYAVRAGDWKLIERENAPPVPVRNKKAKAKGRKTAEKDELFNLAKDPGETTDVSAAHPEVLARLRKILSDARRQGHTR